MYYSHGNTAVPQPGLINSSAPALRPGLEYTFIESPAEYMGCFILHAWEKEGSFSIYFLPICIYSICLHWKSYQKYYFSQDTFSADMSQKKKGLRILLKYFLAFNTVQTLFKCSLTPILSSVKFLLQRFCVHKCFTTPSWPWSASWSLPNILL